MSRYGSASASVTRRGFLRLGCCMTAAAAAPFGRELLAQGKPPGTGAVDVHAHYFPRPFIEAVAEGGGAPGVQFDLSVPESPMFVIGSGRIPLDASYWNLERRIERMNAQGVTTHALSLTTPFVYWAPPERGARLAAIVNDAMLEAHRAFPDRFVGCMTLPVQSTELAVKEVERVGRSRGMRGVYLPSSFGGRELSDPSLFPVYERCEALGLPVLLHPDQAAAAAGVGRLKPFYLANLLGNPFDTAIAASHLVFGGVLDRFPRLDFVLPHAGGALPYLAGRLQHGQRVRPEAKGLAQRPFMDYVKRFHYDTITHSPELLRFLVDLVGVERVMLGSDYCFDMGYDRPREIISQIGLSAADQEKILRGNAARLLRL